jgi:hypothetical protein
MTSSETVSDDYSSDEDILDLFQESDEENEDFDGFVMIRPIPENISSLKISWFSHVMGDKHRPELVW